MPVRQDGMQEVWLEHVLGTHTFGSAIAVLSICTYVYIDIRAIMHNVCKDGAASLGWAVPALWGWTLQG